MSNCVLTRRDFVTASLAALAAACDRPPIATPPPSAGRRYATTFPGIENPLSEGDAWLHHGRHWTKVQKKDGLAYGTQSGVGGYDDSYAYLSGFAPDHQGEAVVHVAPGISQGPHEAELLLRWSDSTFSARGYECLFNFTGDIQIMRWNGPFGDFTEVGGMAGRRSRRLSTGDVLRARIVGSVISCYINGVLLAQATDRVWTDGQPGIGFFKREAGANADLAFSRYTATAATFESGMR